MPYKHHYPISPFGHCPMKKITLIIILISFVSSSVASAAGVEWWARKTFTKGAGKRAVVVATRSLPTNAGRKVVEIGVRRIVKGAATRPYGIAHPLVGSLMLAFGVYSLYVDLDDLVGPIVEDPNLMDPASQRDQYNFSTSACGNNSVVVTRGPVVCTECVNDSNVQYKAKCFNGNFIVSMGDRSGQKLGPARYVTVSYPGGSREDLVADGGSVTVVAGDSSATLTGTESESDIDEDVLENWLNTITDEQLNTVPESTIQETATVPSNADTGPAITPTVTVIEDPVGDPSVDPVTGEPTETQVEPGTDDDEMIVPGQPGIPELDTEIDVPEQKNISDLISDWMANAPFLSVITGLQVQAQGGISEFTVPLPEVLGGTATIDFGEFSDLWAAIGVIIVAISYIYGAMIIFGGKS